MVPGGSKMGSVILDLTCFFYYNYFAHNVFWSARVVGLAHRTGGLRGSRVCQPPGTPQPVSRTTSLQSWSSGVARIFSGGGALRPLKVYHATPT